MKLDTQGGKTVRSGAFAEKKFSIAGTPIAFEILSSRLYTDTFLAIVRELSTNAADSHVAAGCPDKPFDVHLPNRLEPFFSIRDYGTGLAPEDVEEIYTTYFQSTRNHSNDFAGALGLGSKSPFAYSEQFMVESFYDGVHYVYSAFKDNGEPTVAALSASESSEPNGIKITINIKNDSDAAKFQARARDVFTFFKVRPNIYGHKIVYDDLNAVFDGKDYVATLDDHWNGLNVVMGNVRYKVDSSAIDVSAIQGDFFLYMPIGSCSVAANREELHYDAKTIQNVKDVFSAALEDIKNKIKEKIEVASTKLEKAIIKSKLGAYSSLLDESYKLSTQVDNAYSMLTVHVHRNKLRILDDDYKRLINVNNDPLIFIEDDIDEWKQSHKNRLRHWLESEGSRWANLVTIEDRKVFEETFGKPNIKISDLPAVPRKPATINGTRSLVKKIVHSKRLDKSWANVALDTLDPKNTYIVIRENNTTKFDNCSYHPSQVIGFASELLGSDVVVLGVAEKYYKKIKESLKIEDLEVVLRRKVREIFDKMTEFDFFALSSSDSYDIVFLETIKGLSRVCDRLYTAYTTDCPNGYYLNKYLRIWEKIPECPDYAGEFEVRYPLLRYVRNGMSYNCPTEEIQEYIQLREEKLCSGN